MITITEARLDHINDLVPLFDQYRVFYKQPSNEPAAAQFLKDRMQNKESVIFLAYSNTLAVGFVQLYISFSSVSLQPVFILNDLYVAEAQRGKKIGEALLNRAKALCKAKGYKGLALETGIENKAQQLYEKLGWQKDTACFHYFWTAD